AGQAKDSKYFDRYFDGSRKVLTSDERLALGLYLQSYRVHQEHVQTIIDNIGGQGTPDQQAQRILFNYGTFKDQINKETYLFDSVYGAYNREGKNLFGDMIAASTKQDRPNFTIQQTLLLNLLGLLNESKQFLSE